VERTLDTTVPLHQKKLTAAFVTDKKWPIGSIINISFDPPSKNKVNSTWVSLNTLESRGSVDPLEYKVREMSLSFPDVVKKVIKERFAPICDLIFKFTEDRGDIHIGFNPDIGSSSLVGTDCKYESGITMNFAWIDVGTIMHEFGHALGMIHEHQNPKGNLIEWDKDKVYLWAENKQGWDKDKTDRNIIDRYSLDQLNASNFDPNSIMLYFFPASLTKNNKGTSMNQTLSVEDARYIHSIYKGKKDPDDFHRDIYDTDITQNKFLKKPLIYVWLIPIIIFGIILLIFGLRSI
jgi:hypothetical protein